MNLRSRVAAGCHSVDDPVRTARVSPEVGLYKRAKLDAIGDEKTPYPDVVGLVETAKIRLREGFVALPCTNGDLITAKRLVDAGVRKAPDACQAMRLGFEGALLNTAVALAFGGEKMVTVSAGCRRRFCFQSCVSSISRRRASKRT
jgi:thiazole synthase ThiGH ThiG subunit